MGFKSDHIQRTADNCLAIYLFVCYLYNKTEYLRSYYYSSHSYSAVSDLLHRASIPATIRKTRCKHDVRNTMTAVLREIVLLRR